MKIDKTTKQDAREIAQYQAAGYTLIPLHQWDFVDRFKRMRGKSPQDSDWRNRDYRKFEPVRHMKLGKNVGVRLTSEDLVVDADPRNYPEGDDPLARLIADVGLDMDKVPFVNTGSGGTHIYLKKPADVATLETVPAYPGLEFKTLGRQVVSAGSKHDKTGNIYRWDFLSSDLTKQGHKAPDRLLAIIRRPQLSSSAASGEGGEHTPEQLATMLSGLKPEDYRDQSKWLDLMMACHHATAGDGGEEFAEWSTQDPEYADHRNIVLRRWDSLHAEGTGKITYKTLYKALHAKKKDSLIPPATSAEEDFAGLDDDEDPAERAKRLAAGDQGGKGPLEKMNDTYWAVDDGGKFRVYADFLDQTLTPARHYWNKYARQDFENLMASRRIQRGESTINLGKAWIEWGQRRTAKGVVFDPEHKRPGYLNLWSGWSVEPKPGDWSLFKELIETVLADGNPKYAKYILDWCAYLFQYPGRQAEVALCFRGQKGVGKSTLGRVLAELCGRHGLHISNPNHLTGRFNLHLRDCVLLFADEAFWAGDKAGESTLKQLVTEPSVMYEGKGANAEMGKNLVHVVVASNSDWIVPTSIGDERRFAVFDANNLRQRDEVFFNALHAQLQNGGIAGFLHDMLTRDIRGWHPRGNVPVTEALAEQAVHSMTPFEMWFFDLVQNGQLPGGTACCGDWRKETVWAFCDDLYNDFVQGLQERRVTFIPSKNAFGLSLKKLLEGGFERTRVRVHPGSMQTNSADNRAWAYRIPSLKILNNVFEKYLQAMGNVQTRKMDKPGTNTPSRKRR